MSEHETGSGADQPDDTVHGEAPTLGDEKLREASAELLVKREEYGRAVTGTLVGQIAIVGSFLGAFSLLDDNAKAAVVQSSASLVALIAVAVSLSLSLGSYFLLPSRMPSLDNLSALETFWNNRVRVRRAWLVLALIALIVAIAAATAAFADAQDAVAPIPAAGLSGKFTPAKDTASSIEASATWSSLDPGDYALLCVLDPSRKVLGATIGSADVNGAETLSLTVPVRAGTTGMLTLTTVRLSSVPMDDATLDQACDEKSSWLGTPLRSSITVE